MHVSNTDLFQMKKLLFLFTASFVFLSCSPKLISIKESTLKPYTYKKPLLVSKTYFSNKSGFNKLWNQDIRTHERVSSINTRLTNMLQQRFVNDNKNTTTYFVKNNLDTELVLNQPNTKEKKDLEIETAILDNNIDLLITIYPENIQRYYNTGVETGVGVNVGNPNLSLGATTNSGNLKYNYIITATDTHTKLEVWKASYQVNHADNIFTNIPSCLSKKIYERIKEDQLF